MKQVWDNGYILRTNVPLLLFGQKYDIVTYRKNQHFGRYKKGVGADDVSNLTVEYTINLSLG